MDKTTLAYLVAAVMSGVGIIRDYFLKKASGEDNLLLTWPFAVGVVRLDVRDEGNSSWRPLVCMILLLTGMGVFFFVESLTRSEGRGHCSGHRRGRPSGEVRMT